jgi:hypothetical protein
MTIVPYPFLHLNGASSARNETHSAKMSPTHSRRVLSKVMSSGLTLLAVTRRSQTFLLAMALRQVMVLKKLMALTQTMTPTQAKTLT